MHLPIRRHAHIAETGEKAAEAGVCPLAPLREVFDLRAWTNADPRNTPGYVCGLVSATAEAVLSAMKNGRAGGWIFVQENFIRAVRAIRDMNDARGTAYTDRDLEERFPAAWSRMADAVETCARIVPRPCAGVRRIPRDVLGCPAETPEFGWSRPIRGEALQGLFDYCLETTKAALTSPTDRATVETHYKTGVFNVPLNVTRSLSLHTNMLREAAQADARIEDKLDSMAAKLDAIGADAKRSADAAEKAAENSETTGRIVLNHMTPRPGDYEIKQKQLSEILEGLNAKVTVKTIQRWETYLKTSGKRGTKPPEGYTLETRRTLAGATSWAQTYAEREKSKLNTKVSLERLTGGRR